MAASRNDQIVMEALTLLNSGDEAKAKQLLEGVLKRQPTHPQGAKLLAMIHGGHEEDDKALIFLQRSIIGDPTDGETRFMLGNVLLGLKRHKEAAAAYREALRIAPGNVAASDGLGKCLISLGRYQEAITVFRAAINANPDNPDPYGNMGGALVTIAKMEEALAVADEGLRRMPGNAALLEFAAYTMNFPRGTDHAAIKDLHVRFGQALVAASNRPEPAFRRSPDPDRPLRVGFLSGDFAFHACAMFMKAPLLNFNHDDIQPVCFSTVRQTDGGDAPFKSACEWRNIDSRDPAEVAASILSADLDILIDCSGLTEGHRLGALVPRVAPIQCTWLGYPNTTGLPSMDYRIVDWLTDPQGSECQATERLIRLPGCFLCYTPPENAPPPTPTRAALDPDAPITFGSFNRMTKVTPAALDAWAQILRRVPNSRLLLKLRIPSEELRQDAVALFEKRGIEGSRIQMMPFLKHSRDAAAMYAEMDIALDSFPYNGTTTTCEATWMGVPVITLEGDSHRSRVGVSLNSVLGLRDLIAATPADYIETAVRLSADRSSLADFKASLRNRMAASPLCDAPAYAAKFAAALRGIWRAWCAQRSRERQGTSPT